MSTSVVCPSSKHIELPCIYRVSAFQPLHWLREGMRDFLRTWPASLSYGVVFSVMGYALVNYASENLHLAMALTTGFLLVAPFLAIGFYELSSQLEQSQRTGGRGEPFAGVRRNLGSIGLFAFMLAFILSAWERVSAILVGLFLKGDFVSIGYFEFSLLFTGEQLGFVAAYVGFGAMLAGLVFALSVVSLPMLMDRQVDLVTAMMTSLWVVRENVSAMLVWAALIAGLTALGIATAFVALALIFPVLGHATWRGYRELVET